MQESRVCSSTAHTVFKGKHSRCLWRGGALYGGPCYTHNTAAQSTLIRCTHAQEGVVGRRWQKGPPGGYNTTLAAAVGDWVVYSLTNNKEARCSKRALRPREVNAPAFGQGDTPRAESLAAFAGAGWVRALAFSPRHILPSPWRQAPFFGTFPPGAEAVYKWAPRRGPGADNRRRIEGRDRGPTQAPPFRD